MENEHELSYETLTRVYLRSYEHYKSVGVEVELLEPRFDLDDQEWRRKWGMSRNEGITPLLIPILKLKGQSDGMRCHGSVLAELYGLGRDQREDVEHFRAMEMYQGAFKHLRIVCTWSGGPLCCKPVTQHYKILYNVVYIFYTGEGVSFDQRFLLRLSVFAMVAASASRATAIPSEINYRMAA
nr:hypothetical protein [Tanacetum cinerariifolium]